MATVLVNRFSSVYLFCVFFLSLFLRPHLYSARYAYENCVYDNARYICKPDSAVFLRRIAKLLSTDKHFLNCDRIENELCSGAVRVPGEYATVPLLLLLLLPLLPLLLLTVGALR